MKLSHEIRAARMRLQGAGRRLADISRKRGNKTPLLREYWFQVWRDKQLTKGRALKTQPSVLDESTPEAIARCIQEQKLASEIIHTEAGKLYAEDWVKEEVILRLESGVEIHGFDPLPPAESVETRG